MITRRNFIIGMLASLVGACTGAVKVKARPPKTTTTTAPTTTTIAPTGLPRWPGFTHGFGPIT
jgi:hypothetical protein